MTGNDSQSLYISASSGIRKKEFQGKWTRKNIFNNNLKKKKIETFPGWHSDNWKSHNRLSHLCTFWSVVLLLYLSAIIFSFKNCDWKGQVGQVLYFYARIRNKNWENKFQQTLISSSQAPLPTFFFKSIGRSPSQWTPLAFLQCKTTKASSCAQNSPPKTPSGKGAILARTGI